MIAQYHTFRPVKDVFLRRNSPLFVLLMCNILAEFHMRRFWCYCVRFGLREFVFADTFPDLLGLLRPRGRFKLSFTAMAS